MLGTAAYMAPEQARGASVDRRADIWSFGAVLWEMLTGKRAFEGDTVSDTLASVLRAPIEWKELPPSTPRGVVRLLERCLERDSKKRLRDIGEARIALETLGAEPEAAPPAPPAAAPPRSRPSLGLAWRSSHLRDRVVGFLRSRKAQQVTRFQIPPTRLASTELAPSRPDGRNVAFLGRDTGGKQSIWVRPLDAFARFAPGLGGRQFLRSPDSRYVAYFIGGASSRNAGCGGPGSSSGGRRRPDGTWAQAATSSRWSRH